MITDNRKLDALLSIRGILTNTMTSTKNSLTAMDSVDLNDNDSNNIYQRVNFFFKSKYDLYSKSDDI